jgi:hypothetical protein
MSHVILLFRDIKVNAVPCRCRQDHLRTKITPVLSSYIGI